MAQKDLIYMNAGVVHPSEVALSRYGGGKFSTQTEIDVDSREKELKNDIEAALNPPAEPPPPPPDAPPNGDGTPPPGDLKQDCHPGQDPETCHPDGGGGNPNNPKEVDITTHFKNIATPHQMEELASALKTRRFISSQSKQINPHELLATQESLSIRKLQRVANKTFPDKNIEVIKVNGKYFIDDGHHRTAIAMKEGQASIGANVMDLDATD